MMFLGLFLFFSCSCVIIDYRFGKERRTMKYAVLFYVAMSVVTFFAYGKDKIKAQKHRYRTPESILLGLGLFGGAVGALLGMRIFHHKTRHWYFLCLNLLALALHAMLFYLLFV